MLVSTVSSWYASVCVCARPACASYLFHTYMCTVMRNGYDAHNSHNARHGQVDLPVEEAGDVLTMCDKVPPSKCECTDIDKLCQAIIATDACSGACIAPLLFRLFFINSYIPRSRSMHACLLA